MSKDSKVGEIESSGVVAAGPQGPRSGRAERRTFTAEYKAAIVAEYDAAAVGEKGAVLRRERLYDSHLREWKAALAAGTLEKSSAGRRRKARPAGPTRSEEQTRIAELEKALAAEKAAHERTRAELESTGAALDVLGKGVAFLEALSSKNA